MSTKDTQYHEQKKCNTALVDSGAQLLNIVSDKLLSEKQRTNTRKTRPITATGVGGTIINIDKTINMILRIESTKGNIAEIPTKFHVVNDEDLSKDDPKIILSNAWIIGNDIDILSHKGKQYLSYKPARMLFLCTNKRNKDEDKINTTAIKADEETYEDNFNKFIQDNKQKLIDINKIEDREEYAEALKIFIQENFKKLLDKTTLPGANPNKYKVNVQLKEVQIKPIKQYNRYTNPIVKKKAMNEIQRFISLGIIEKVPEEQLPKQWLQRALIRTKSNGKVRIVTDNKPVNEYIKFDETYLPSVEETLLKIQETNANYYTMIDKSDAFYQIHNASSYLFGFVGPDNIAYRFKRLPQGMKNSSQIYSSVMREILYLCNAVIYVDDILIPSNTKEEHTIDVLKTLYRLQEADMRLKIEKCEFAKEEVTFLGFKINKDNIQIDPERINSLLEAPHPHNQKSLQRWLGIANTWRKFIKNYAEIIEPLQELVGKYKTVKQTEKSKEAIKLIKEALTSQPILKNPDWSKKFYVDPDASKPAIGAALLQEHDGTLHPVAYYSCKLDKHQMKYGSGDRELVGVVKALNRWKNIIQECELIITTDHKPNTSFLTTDTTDPHISDRRARWVERLREFNIREIKYRKGEEHIVADFMSRLHIAGILTHTPQQKLHISSIKIENQKTIYKSLASILVNQHNITTLSDPYTNENLYKLLINESLMKNISKRERRRLDNIASLYSVGYKEGENGEMTPTISRKQTKEYPNDRIVPPTDERKQIINDNHTEHAHSSTDQTIKRLQKVYYWPSLHTDVASVIHTCPHCIHAGLRQLNTQHDGTIQSPEIFHTIAYDLIGPLPTSHGGNIYILVIIDVFSKWIELCPIPDHTAKTVAEALFSTWFSRYGMPKRVICDGGPEFKNAVLEYILYQAKTKLHHTTPCNHTSNAVVERANREINRHIRAMMYEFGEDWEMYLEHVSYAMRTQVHRTTGDTPYRILFGKDPEPLTTSRNTDLIPKWSYDRIRNLIEKIRPEANQRLQKYWEKRVLQRKPKPYYKPSVGDFVFIKNEKEHPSKYEERFLKTPYKITEEKENNRYTLENTENSRDVRDRTINQFIPYQKILENEESGKTAENKSEESVITADEKDNETEQRGCTNQKNQEV